MSGDQLGMDGSETPVTALEKLRRLGGNPLLAMYGPGPEGVTCRGCIHLERELYHDRTYLKCELRRHTRGKGSDHRAGWPSCGRYEQTG